jgi:hypothetical protein
VAERRAAVEGSEEDLDEVRAQLGALSTLGFTSKGHAACIERGGGGLGGVGLGGVGPGGGVGGSGGTGGSILRSL